MSRPAIIRTIRMASTGVRYMARSPDPLKDIFDRQIVRIAAQDILAALSRANGWRTTAWVAAASNMRHDVALERLGALERQGDVTSRLVRDGSEMAWALPAHATTRGRSENDPKRNEQGP